MEEQQNFDDALLGQQKKGIDYYLEQIKLTAFQVLYVLRKDEDQADGMTLFYVQNAIDYFQMHQFPFYVTIYYLWKQDTFMEFINQVQNLFQISNYIPSLSYESLLLTVYTLLFFILLIIADIMYVSYSFSKNRFQVMWPLYILRSIASLVVTVLFLPITETLTAILQCYVDPETGLYIIYGYSNINVECWVGWHTFHALVDLAFILIFVIICGVVAYAFFEPSMTSQDRSARQDSQGEVAFITNKITCQLMYSLLRPNYPEQAWLMVILTFLLSVWLFKIYNFDDPYYDFGVGLFYCICSTYYLWASFMLLVCKMLESSSFTGGFIAWCLGVPFIVSIMYLTKKSKIETLITSQTKFRSGEQMWSHIRYVLQLIQNQETDKNSYMLLVGYIEKHKETCANDDCPLKSQRLKKVRRTQKLDIDEQIRGLIQELDKMFVIGLKKFPNSVQLRIFYALFLIERRNNKQKALEQFELASFSKPALYQQFIIYRYKKDLKKGINNKNEGDDIVNLIAFNNHLLMCEEMMKFSANLHKEFWIELKEEQPDLGRLMNIGARISAATNQAKENYYKMQKLNPNVPQTIKVFGTFMISVLNDSKRGQELLNQAKFLKDMLKKTSAVHKDIINYEQSHVPFIYVSAKKSEQGTILNTNSLFTSYFGYGKEEIIGKRINVLMPQKYSETHDKYMNAFFENIVLNIRQEAEMDSNYLDVEQNRLFKHKNGYIFPLLYKVTLHIDSLIYITTFRGEPQLKTSVHFILDKTSQIIEMSSSAITFFDIELKQLADKIKLNDYIGDVLSKNNKDVEAKTNKNRNDISQRYYFNCQVKEITLPKRNRDDSDDDNKDFLNVEKTGNYIVRLDKIEKNEANLKYLSKRKDNSGSLASQQLSSDLVIASLTNVGNTQKVSINQSNDSCTPLVYENLEIDPNFMVYMQDLYETPNIDEFKNLFENANNLDSNSLPSIDYSGNIITKRLINNQIISINEEQEEMFLQLLADEEEEDSLFRNNGNNFEDEDDYKLFTYSNSATIITNALNAHHRHDKITIFKIYSSMWIIFILTVTSLQYYFCAKQFQEYKVDIEIIQIVNTQLVEINMITSRVLDFCIHHLGLYDYNHTQLQDDISESAKSIIQFNSYINSEQYLQFSSYYTKQVSFRFYQDGSYYIENNITLESSILLLAALSLNTSQITIDVALSNTFAQGVIQNFFNVINQEIINISQSLYTSIKDIMDNPQVDLLILLAVSIFVSMMAMTKFIFLMFDIKTQRENILFLFLDIPTNHVEILYRKCDKFLKQYVSVEELRNKNEVEGYESSEDEADNENYVVKLAVDPDEDDSALRQSQNRRKIIKKYRQNRLKGNQGIIAQFFIISLFTLIFTVYNILSSQSEQGQINFLIPQYYQSIYNTNNYAYYINLQKLMMLNYSTQINNNSINDLVLSELDLFTGNALKLNSFNLELLTRMQTFRDHYVNLYYGDICNLVNATECQSLINNNLQLGVYNVESYYLEYFRQNLEQFQEDPSYNSILLGKQQFFEIDRSLYKYIFTATRDLIEVEKTLIIDDMNSTQNIQMILLIVFIVVLLMIFLFIWLPFLEGLNTQINQTIEMLNMVPLNVIKENKSIRRFVKNLIKSMKIY